MTKTSVLNLVRRSLFQYPFVESKLRRITSGREVTDWVSKLVPNHYQYPPASLRRIDGSAGPIELDLSDLMEWHFYYNFINPSADQVAKLCETGDVVLDIGANIGAIMLKAASVVGTEGRVIGFEPDTQRFNKCKKNLAAHNHPQTELHPLALGNRQGQDRIRVRSIHNQGMNQIVPVGADPAGTTAVVMTTLDEFTHQQNLHRVNVIKVDVEGYEAEVLKGGIETIARFRPKLFLEIDDRNLREHGSRPSEIFELLKACDYQLYQENIKKPLVESVNESCHFDLLALPNL